MMQGRFSAQRGPTRVVFGCGAAAGAPEEVAALGVKRVLVVCSPRRASAAQQLAERLGPLAVGVAELAREHVPMDGVVQARARAAQCGADAVLAFGGGSAIGLAKAVALEGQLRVIALPTTYSGSEMTPIFGISEGGEKRTGRDERVRAALVIYDPELTLGLSRDVTVQSLWNAMAHAVEALWAPSPDRATLLTAEEGLRLVAQSLPRLQLRPDDLEARAAALEGAFLCGVALADSSTGLHHKLCHVLGGSFSLPHAATHSVLLPHVVRLFRDAAPVAMAAIARALGVIDPVAGMAQLARRTGAPLALEPLGLPHDALDRAAALGWAVAPAHPRRPNEAELRSLLELAYRAPAAAVAPAPIRGPETLELHSGFGSLHESEALAGALPRRQNTPRPAPYGLYPELLSGTPFTVRAAENSKVWMYRVRPSFDHEPLRRLPEARFVAQLDYVEANRTRWRPHPIPEPPERVDFLDGLVTLGGAGDPTMGPGYGVHIYAANADMVDRSFASCDGDLLIVPQTGTLECRTELGWLRATPGSVLVVPRGIKFAVGVSEAGARGWMVEVFGSRFRLPERGPIGSNGLADARHFMAPTAAYEDRPCPEGFQVVQKLGGNLWEARQEHSPFDVVAWQGNHAPHCYDLSLFNAMGSVTWDHADPSILTVLTAPLDDHGRAIVDFVVFPGRWDVAEHSFRPPYMHRNAATEINAVIRVAEVESGYDPGCTFVTPLLTPHGITAEDYDRVLSASDEVAEGPKRIPDESLWVMFESALPFRTTRWARETPQLDREFLSLFAGAKKRFDPSGPGA